MATFGKPRIMGRLLAMLLLIVALVVGGLFWFDYLGLIDAKAFFAPALSLVGLAPRTGKALPAGAPALLDDERLAKQLEAVDARNEELGSGRGPGQARGRAGPKAPGDRGPRENPRRAGEILQ